MSMRAGVIATFAIALGAVGCSTADPDKRIDPVGPPAANFDVVVGMLGHRCGSLDCHGASTRNLHIYGYGGSRLNPTDTPDAPPTTTPNEIVATYDSVVGLEPEMMRKLVVEKFIGPGRLTLVRKARGEEEHKGGARIAKGDDADLCLLSWLNGAVDVAACKRVPEEF
jgi:hypothetical protein